jgi:hypothetical protein
LAELLEDWVTIWQSELSGLIVDREMQDALLRVVDGWAAQSRAALRILGPALRGVGPDGATPPSGTNVSPGSKAAAAAPDGRDAVIQQLLDRVAELERRIGTWGPPAD